MDKNEFIKQAIFAAKAFFAEFNLRTQGIFEAQTKTYFLWFSSYPEVLSYFGLPPMENSGPYSLNASESIEANNYFTLTMIVVDKSDRNQNQYFSIDFVLFADRKFKIELGVSTIYPKAGEELVETICGQPVGHTYDFFDAIEKIAKISMQLHKDRQFYEEYFDQHEISEYVE